MSAIHYKARNTVFRLTPNRAINAAAEIEMILEAKGADGLGTAIIERLATTVKWLQDEVTVEIQRVMDEAKASSASSTTVEVVWPSVDEVAALTAKQLVELATVLSVDLTGVKASKGQRLEAIEKARPAPKGKGKGKTEAAAA